ncbi:MAG: DUF4194 domain-containing protein [Nitrospirae bacterium]|nr:DUF4194 domain-containing protein [Nitrospirota bacterium]
MMEQNIPIYAPALIRLLQGVIYHDDKALWDSLINCQNEVKAYFSVIGVRVHINESEGFAFLEQKKFEEGPGMALPKLVDKRPLSYPVTLLCVLLVERLIEFDTMGGGDSTRLILDGEEIKEMVRVFLPANFNEAKLIDRIDTDINKLVEYGFLRRLAHSENKYEVKRILKAKISAETLNEIKSRLQEYVKSIP